MKARIEKLKKLSKLDLIIVASKFMQTCKPMGEAGEPCIEIVSARMWEKAVKECRPKLFEAMECQYEEVGEEWVVIYFCYDATPTEKLICATAAIEAGREAKSDE